MQKGYKEGWGECTYIPQARHKGWGHTGGYYKRGGFHCKSKNEVLSELECGYESFLVYAKIFSLTSPLDNFGFFRSRGEMAEKPEESECVPVCDASFSPPVFAPVFQKNW